MPYGHYLEIGSDDPELDRYGRALADHARDVLVGEVFDASEAELDELDAALLRELLAAPTACRRDAEPAAGPFPLVVYHSGAGSSFEDNALLCEHLASHGYAVLGSAFPRAAGDSFEVDARDGSAADLAFLVRHARGLEFVDWGRVALAGHSLGAQAVLRAGARPGCVADALVLLDTTQDYYTLAVPGYGSLIEETTANAEWLGEPMLVAAGPAAMFRLCDRFDRSERTYVTFPELDHNEFVSQGLQRLAVLERRAARDPGATPSAAADRAAPVRREYAALGELVRLFLDAHLRGAPAPLAARLEPLRATALGGPDLHAESAPRGQAGPEPYDEASDRPPSPRQLGPLLAERGAAATVAVLERFRDREPRSPVYTSSMLMGSVLYELVEADRREEARALHAFAVELNPNVLGALVFLADVQVLLGRPEAALPLLQAALSLDPELERAAERLRELRE